jgi:hypothetical protein
MSGDSEKAGEGWPRTLALSNNVNVKVGFNTDRAKVMVRTGLPWPVPKEVALWLEPDDVPRVEAVIAAYKEWLAKPQAEREFTGEKES